MQEYLFYIATLWLTVLLGTGVVVLVRARSVATRILVLDTLTLVMVALLAVLSIAAGSPHYLDAALLLALLSFVATLAAARYYGEGSPFS